MMPSTKNAAIRKTMRVATTFTGAAACAAAFAPAAMAGTGQSAGGAHPAQLRQAMRPATETSCNAHVCMGLYGGGSYVSYINGHWYGGTGCHIGHIAWYSPKGFKLEGSFTPNAYFCSKAEMTHIIKRNYPSGTSFCVWFNNIDASLPICEAVR